MTQSVTSRPYLALILLSILIAAANAIAGDPDTGISSVSCSSDDGAYKHCPANTSAGVVMVHATGKNPCLLGKSWGYDDAGIWVQDGCSGEFSVAAVHTDAVSAGKTEMEYRETAAGNEGHASDRWSRYEPGKGFVLARTDLGEVDWSVFSYVRYLNQTGLDDSYTDSFGRTFPIDIRNDFQMQKVTMNFKGWLFDPRFRYHWYIWTSNSSQGDPAQVVVAGNLGYQFFEKFSL